MQRGGRCTRARRRWCPGLGRELILSFPRSSFELCRPAKRGWHSRYFVVEVRRVPVDGICNRDWNNDEGDLPPLQSDSGGQNVWHTGFLSEHNSQGLVPEFLSGHGDGMLSDRWHNRCQLSRWWDLLHQ